MLRKINLRNRLQFTRQYVTIFGKVQLSARYIFRKAWLSTQRDFKYIHKTCDIKEKQL